MKRTKALRILSELKAYFETFAVDDVQYNRKK